MVWVTLATSAASDAWMFPGLRTNPEVYDCQQVRESMVPTLPHPTLGDLDVPGSPLPVSDHTEQRREARPVLRVDQDDVLADYVRSGDDR